MRETLAEIIARHERWVNEVRKGVGVADIAEAEGTTTYAVRMVLRRAGITPPKQQKPKRPTGPPPAMLQKWIDAYLAGATGKEIAEQFRVSPSRVYKALNAAQVTRPPGPRPMSSKGKINGIRSIHNQERVQRAQQWAERLRAGETLRSLALEVGLTYQAVSMALQNAGFCPADIRRERSDEQAAVKRVEDVIEAMAASMTRPPCVVCGSWVIRGSESTVTCSQECATLWPKIRWYTSIDEYDKHRRQCAKWILGHPDNKSQSRLDWAKRMLSDNPPPPNRRFSRPTSVASQAREAAGLELERFHDKEEA